MRATLFKDPTTGKLYLVAVHHLSGTVTAKVRFSSSLKVDEAVDRGRKITVKESTLVADIGSYGARLYRLS